MFKELSGANGDGSNITLNGNIFIGNRAQSFGGGIFANNSLIMFDRLSRNVFQLITVEHYIAYTPNSKG
jgi:hypothetical protein